MVLALLSLLTVFACPGAPCGVAGADPSFVNQLQALARQGDGEAQLALALLYEHGEQGLERNLEKALALFQQSAQAGLPAACLYLGLKYENGSGVAQDSQEAARWYCCAARKGWAMAQFFLAALYEKGKGVGKDRITALAWYGLAAEQGYPGAEEARKYLFNTMSEDGQKRAIDFRSRFHHIATDCTQL